ncbi:MAG: MliC family protein [Marinibacterium sp.]|nr:MliC family protein [Marinibacterium sp.]
MAVASPPPDFTCDLTPDPKITLRFGEVSYPLTGNLYYTDGERMAFTAYPTSDAEWWPQVPSASGQKFEKDGITVFLKGDEGLLELPDGSSFSCVRATGGGA